tara:strand:+ start:56 stop:379 length:324 start_codon:yes stop_codon:yes gene_type:complete
MEDEIREIVPQLTYTKEQVDMLIAAAVAEAHEMDVRSMAKHNKTATIISMILGFTCLALFLDGTLRLLGIIPPFLDIDISIVDKIREQVEQDVIPQIQKYQRYIPKI